MPHPHPPLAPPWEGDFGLATAPERLGLARPVTTGRNTVVSLPSRQRGEGAGGALLG
jgi:hypothetical protein